MMNDCQLQWAFALATSDIYYILFEIICSRAELENNKISETVILTPIHHLNHQTSHMNNLMIMLSQRR